MYDFRIKTSSGWHYVRLNSLPRSCGCDGSLTEWLIDALETQHSLMVLPEDLLVVRNLERKENVGTRIIRLYYSHRQYGGPEEGGWCYDAQQTERTYVVPAKNYYRHLARFQRYCDAVNKGLAPWDSGAALRVTGQAETKRSARTTAEKRLSGAGCASVRLVVQRDTNKETTNAHDPPARPRTRTHHHSRIRGSRKGALREARGR